MGKAYSMVNPTPAANAAWRDRNKDHRLFINLDSSALAQVTKKPPDKFLMDWIEETTAMSFDVFIQQQNSRPFNPPMPKVVDLQFECVVVGGSIGFFRQNRDLDYPDSTVHIQRIPVTGASGNTYIVLSVQSAQNRIPNKLSSPNPIL